MKAVKYLGPGHIDMVDIARPSPGAGEVLVETRAVAICNQTDIRVYNGVRTTYPMQPGEPGAEGAGIITEIGKGVRGFKVGQPVAMFGTRLYAEYSVRRTEELAPLTVGTGLVEAAPLALAGAVIAALRKGPDMKGRTVLITGLGPAGLFLVQLARNAGAGEIIAQDIRPDRFDLAHGLGATATALANDREVINRFREQPADIGVDCSGSPQAVSLLYSMCTTVIVFGTVDETVKIEIPRGRLLTLVNGYLTREERCEGLGAAVKLFLRKKLETRPLISQTMLLEEYALAMQKVRRGEVVKLVLTRS